MWWNWWGSKSVYNVMGWKILATIKMFLSTHPSDEIVPSMLRMVEVVTISYLNPHLKKIRLQGDFSKLTFEPGYTISFRVNGNVVLTGNVTSLQNFRKVLKEHNHKGKLYVVDSMNFRVQILTSKGKPIRQFGSNGDGHIRTETETDVVWFPCLERAAREDLLRRRVQFNKDLC